MSAHPGQASLAVRAGIAGVATHYERADGTRVEVPEESLAVVLDALEERALAPTGVLEPARVSRRSSLPVAVAVALEESVAVEVRWALELETEDGGVLRDYGTATPDPAGRFRIPCTWVPATGYHTLLAVVETGNRRWHGEQRWIVAPDSCWPAAEPLAGELGFGVMAQTHSLRSDHDWGCGDLGDIIELCRRAAALGADFIALSPLHALVLHGNEVSPYSPTSRLFRNPLLIDVDAVPELESSTATRSWLERDDVEAHLAELRAKARVDYDDLRRFKVQALRRLHREFVRQHRGKDTTRGRAYALFRRDQGALLDSWAVFQTLFDLFHEVDGHTDWRDWPAAYRDASSATVRAFAAAHTELIDFQRFLQFEVDRQLAQAASAARAAGMRIGLVHDLALGSYAGGFDTWAFADLFVGGLELGCPPDPLGPDGQSWGLPPLDPARLAADGYRFWTRLVRTALAHGGGVRIDHVLGLVRQFWVPHGSLGSEGTYVRVPREALLGILALESERSRGVVVGEDLGTVPAGMDALLERWQILSTRVVPFVRAADGSFPPPAAHQARALLLATTHDLPTVAAWWRSDDLDLLRRLGLLDDAAWAAAHAARVEDRHALTERLVTEGLLDAEAPRTQHGFVAAVHAYMARTPARLVGVWLEDAAGERLPTNLPGVDPSRFPPWRRRLETSLQTIFRQPQSLEILRAAQRP